MEQTLQLQKQQVEGTLAALLVFPMVRVQPDGLHVELINEGQATAKDIEANFHVVWEQITPRKELQTIATPQLSLLRLRKGDEASGAGRVSRDYPLPGFTVDTWESIRKELFAMERMIKVVGTFNYDNGFGPVEEPFCHYTFGHPSYRRNAKSPISPPNINYLKCEEFQEEYDRITQGIGASQ